MTLRLYLRRSKGDEHQQFSLEVQRDGARHLLGHLQKLGLVVAWETRLEYVDDDRAGDDFIGRAGLQRLLKETEAGDVIICRDQSRLGRDAVEVTLAIRVLVRDRAARLFYYVGAQEVSCATAIEQATTFIAGTGHQMELEALRSRTREALRARVKLGRLAGGACYGYRNVQSPDLEGKRKNTVAVVDEQQADVVRHMFALARTGRGFKAIASEMNSAGHSTMRGGVWSKGAVRVVLTNARYRGVYIHGRVNRTRSGGRRVAKRARPDEIMVVEVPEWRIVDDLTWYAVQAQFKAREKGPQSPGPATKYALSGIARCGSCGGAVGAAARTAVSVGGVRSNLPAYACIAHRGKGSCSISVAQRVDEVDGAVADYLQTHVLTPAVIEQLISGIREEIAQQSGAPKANLTEMEQRLQRLKSEQRNLARAVATGGDGIPELVDELRTRQRRIEELQISLETARRTPAMMESVFEKVEKVVRLKLSDLRTALGGDPTGARDVYMSLFPEGLVFEPAEVVNPKKPRHTRRVWTIRGMAHIGVCNLVVTPEGIEPSIPT